jgi:hypothetical protein
MSCHNLDDNGVECGNAHFKSFITRQLFAMNYTQNVMGVSGVGIIYAEVATSQNFIALAEWYIK